MMDNKLLHHTKCEVIVVRGIYIIECLVNGKKYVGCSSDLKSRLIAQKSNLNNPKYNKKHVNKHLYNDVQKYGWNNFKITQFELPSNKTLKDYESEMMLEHNSIYPHGYNLRRDYNGEHFVHKETLKLYGGRTGENNPNFGNHWSEESKRKMSDIKKEQHASGEIYTEEWRRKQGENAKKFWQENPDKKLQMAERVSKSKQKYRVIKCDMEGNEIKTYESMKEAVKDNEGFRDIGIYNACNGYRPSYRGYKWKRQLKI